MSESIGGWRSEVQRLLAEGEWHARMAENAEALACYIEALDQVPEPRGKHQETAPIFHGLQRVLEARGDLGDGMELLLATRPGLSAMLAGLTGRGTFVG